MSGMHGNTRSHLQTTFVDADITSPAIIELRQRLLFQEQENQELRSKVFTQEEMLFDLQATMTTFEVEVKTQSETKLKNVSSELAFKKQQYSALEREIKSLRSEYELLKRKQAISEVSAVCTEQQRAPSNQAAMLNEKERELLAAMLPIATSFKRTKRELKIMKYSQHFLSAVQSIERALQSVAASDKSVGLQQAAIKADTHKAYSNYVLPIFESHNSFTAGLESLCRQLVTAENPDLGAIEALSLCCQAIDVILKEVLQLDQRIRMFQAKNVDDAETVSTTTTSESISGDSIKRSSSAKISSLIRDMYFGRISHLLHLLGEWLALVHISTGFISQAGLCILGCSQQGAVNEAIDGNFRRRLDESQHADNPNVSSNIHTSESHFQGKSFARNFSRKHVRPRSNSSSEEGPEVSSLSVARKKPSVVSAATPTPSQSSPAKIKRSSSTVEKRLQLSYSTKYSIELPFAAVRFEDADPDTSRSWESAVLSATGGCAGISVDPDDASIVGGFSRASNMNMKLFRQLPRKLLLLLRDLLLVLFRLLALGKQTRSDDDAASSSAFNTQRKFIWTKASVHNKDKGSNSENHVDSVNLTTNTVVSIINRIIVANYREFPYYSLFSRSDVWELNEVEKRSACDEDLESDFVSNLLVGTVDFSQEEKQAATANWSVPAALQNGCRNDGTRDSGAAVPLLLMCILRDCPRPCAIDAETTFYTTQQQMIEILGNIIMSERYFHSFSKHQFLDPSSFDTADDIENTSFISQLRILMTATVNDLESVGPLFGFAAHFLLGEGKIRSSIAKLTYVVQIIKFFTFITHRYKSHGLQLLLSVPIHLQLFVQESGSAVRSTPSSSPMKLRLELQNYDPSLLLTICRLWVQCMCSLDSQPGYFDDTNTSSIEDISHASRRRVLSQQYSKIIYSFAESLCLCLDSIIGTTGIAIWNNILGNNIEGDVVISHCWRFYNGSCNPLLLRLLRECSNLECLSLSFDGDAAESDLH